MSKVTKKDQQAFINSIDLSTRKKRREAAELAVDFIELIYRREATYQQRIPLNLQGGDAYAAAEETMDTLHAAMDDLLSAYDF